jgi:hypothetical protein
MAGSRGSVKRFFPVNVTGLDTRVWQKDGSANDAEGVVFTLRGEVAKVKGIVTLIDWTDGSPDFQSNGAFALYQLHHHGSTEILVSYDDKIAVVEGNELHDLISDLRSQRRPRDAARACQYADMIMFFDGLSQNQRWDGHVVAPVGITAPPPQPRPVLIDTASTSELFTETAMKKGSVTTTYSYVQTYINDRGQESEASIVGSTNDGAIGTTGFLYNVAVVSDCSPQQDNVVSRRFYRATDGLTYTLVRAMPGIKGKLFMDYTPAGNEPSTVVLSPEGTNAPPPVSKSAFVFRGRTYYWGNSDTPSFLFYSGLNAPEAVPTQNVLDVSSADGDIVTGHSVAQDYALVFKRRSIYLLSHDREEQPLLSPISQGIGAVSDRAIVQFDGRVYFLSDDGFMVTDGSRTQPLSRELDEWVRLLPKAHMPDAFGWSDRSGRRVMLSVNAGGSDYNNEVWAIHVDTGAITRLTGFILGAAMNYKEETLVIYRIRPNVWELGLWDADQNIADSTGYTGKFETKWLDMGSPFADKRFSHAIVYYVQDGSHDLTVDWAVSWDDRTNRGSTTMQLSYTDADGNNNATLWNDGNWDTSRKWDGARTRSARVDIADDNEDSVLGKSIQLAFSTTGPNTPFHIVGFEVHYEEFGDRQDGTDATF